MRVCMYFSVHMLSPLCASWTTGLVVWAFSRGQHTVRGAPDFPRGHERHGVGAPGVTADGAERPGWGASGAEPHRGAGRSPARKNLPHVTCTPLVVDLPFYIFGEYVSVAPPSARKGKGRSQIRGLSSQTKIGRLAGDDAARAVALCGRIGKRDAKSARRGSAGGRFSAAECALPPRLDFWCWRLLL